MAKRTHLIIVQGESSKWGVQAEITRAAAADMRRDGIEVHELYYVIPEWAFNVPKLPRLIMFMQDVFFFRNPFTK